jgi:hypothetical protein
MKRLFATVSVLFMLIILSTQVFAGGSMIIDSEYYDGEPRIVEDLPFWYVQDLEFISEDAGSIEPSDGRDVTPSGWFGWTYYDSIWLVEPYCYEANLWVTWGLCSTSATKMGTLG